MANFDLAYPLTKAHEGGWINDPNDPGGNTYCGITQKNYPHLSIWKFLEGETYVAGKIFPELMPDVIAFYKPEYWDKMRGDEINDIAIAVETFDMGVLKGLSTSIQLTQAAAGVPQTGHMDDVTIDALNNPTV